jgi:hypothetical protein
LPESEAMGTRILVTLVALAGVACASGGRPQEDLERLERSRFEAMTRQDITALEPMLADDLVYCHSDATCEGKPEFLETIRSGRIRYLKLQVLERRPYTLPLTFGQVVVFGGVLAIEGMLGDQQRSFNVVFTEVYARRDGRWQLVAYHSTRKP